MHASGERAGEVADDRLRRQRSHPQLLDALGGETAAGKISFNSTVTLSIVPRRLQERSTFVPAAWLQKRLKGSIRGSVFHWVTSRSPTFIRMSPSRMPALY